MKSKFLYLPILILLNTVLCAAQTPQNVELANEINHLYKIDQSVQTDIVSAFQKGVSKEKIDELFKVQTDTFKKHIPALKKIMQEHGFPSFELVGREASNNFFTMVQHSDSDIEFQKSFLKKAKTFVKKKQFDARKFAYLTDRVNLNSGRPQIYGTQVTYDKDGRAFPKNLKDAQNVNKKRASVGLETIEDYLKKVTELHRKQITKNSSGQTRGDYLSSLEIQKSANSETNIWKLQDYAVLFSKIGNYKASLAVQKLYLEKNRATVNAAEKPKADNALLSSYKPENAVSVITKTAKNYRVVITNEAHYQPQNRVFTALLLEKLYKQGFRYFAVEDLYTDDPNVKSKEDKELNARKYPLKTTGFYMNEPQYGNLVRKALKIGYTLVAYEHYASEIKNPIERILARERGQAKNIARILEEDPRAKILVHCGYGHLNEKLKNNNGLMAAMLKKDFNIDPLTIDQEDLLEEKNSPYYDLTSVKEPSVFVSDEGFFNDFSESHKVDMVVVFPKTKYVNGRPDWLVYDKTRRYYFVKSEENKWIYPIMIAAYRQGEDISTAVPADIVEIEKPTDKIALVLNKGQYILQVKDAAGNLLEQTAKVK